MHKLSEIVLARRADGVDEWSFLLADEHEHDRGAVAPGADALGSEITEYIMVQEAV